MRLRDLDPQFLKLLKSDLYDAKIESITDADGIMFLCPACFKANNGPIGTHEE